MRAMKTEDKLITFTVPCYNSEAYMRNCIDSILVGGDDIEIIIVNDGSTKDKTAEIADEYQAKYPNICRAIHKENGGHGSGVNAGIKNARGKYFKVVDSDDWVDKDALINVLNKLRELEKNKTNIDLFIANYVYERVSLNEQKVVDFSTKLPKNKVFSWDDMGKFGPNEFLAMHTLIYRTQILWDSKIELPKHTFYVDNIFASLPLIYVDDIYYMDEDLYRYFIGRDDQSVNEDVMLRQIDQQIKVCKIICENYDYKKTIEKSPKLAHYMLRLIRILSVISTVFLNMHPSEENQQKRKNYWVMIRETQPELYGQIRYYWGNTLINLPGVLGSKVSRVGYKITNKMYKFS